MKSSLAHGYRDLVCNLRVTYCRFFLIFYFSLTSYRAAYKESYVSSMDGVGIGQMRERKPMLCRYGNRQGREGEWSGRAVQRLCGILRKALFTHILLSFNETVPEFPQLNSMRHLTLIHQMTYISTFNFISDWNLMAGVHGMEGLNERHEFFNYFS